MFMHMYMGLKQQKCIASQFWRLKKSGRQGRTLSETRRGTFPCLFLASGGLLEIFDISWLVASELQFLPLSSCLSLYGYLIKMQAFHLGAHPFSSMTILVTSSRTRFPKKKSFWLGFQHIFLRGHNSTYNSLLDGYEMVWKTALGKSSCSITRKPCKAY